MNGRQTIALIAPAIVLGVMYPVFQLLGHLLGNDLGWYAGLMIYWVLWGALYPSLLLSPRAVCKLVRPQKASFGALLLVAIPLVFAATGRLAGSGYDKPASWVVLALTGTALANGLFEELLWRGTYMVLFPDNLFFRFIWPSTWFGLWHLAPGSVGHPGPVARLVIGAAIFGLYLAYLAKRTNTIWWAIVAHTLAGLIAVL